MQPYFQGSPIILRRMFDSYIEDKSSDFVGRAYVFDAIDGFIKNSSSGYFIIRGYPGIGKSALLAKLIKDRGYICHFNIALQNIRSTRAFLENICLQLIARYHLPHQELPQKATEDSGFLSQCLSEASANPENKPIVIAVDALDEADLTGLAPSVNALYLPGSLPSGVFFIVSVRQVFDLHLQVANQQILDLQADSSGNLMDISTYIQAFTSRDQMARRISKLGIGAKAFTEALVKKSQGNFMYLHYVLPAIEAGKFESGSLEELPDGLLAYYRRHWRQMQEGNEEEFETLYEPIVCILAVAQEPITIRHISNWTKINQSQVKLAIRKWREFLLETLRDNDHLYRIYHTTFQEFLAAQVDLTKYDGMIADYYLRLARME